MHQRELQLDRHYVRVRFAVAALLIVGLAGCAELTQRPVNPSSEAVPYIGVFTGEYVDGKPLFRFPPIHVLGSRSSVAPGT